jgi:hypothetical protein
MRYLFFFFCLYSLLLKAQDTTVLAKCDASIGGEMNNFVLTHSILQCLDTIIFVQEFFNNSNKAVFAQPHSTIYGYCTDTLKQDPEIYHYTIEYGFSAETNDEVYLSLLVLPGRKAKYTYKFEKKEELAFYSNNQYNPNMQINRIGGEFSFFDYPFNIPIHYFLNKPYMKGLFNRWYEDNTKKGIYMQYISLFCTIPEK